MNNETKQVEQIKESNQSVNAVITNVLKVNHFNSTNNIENKESNYLYIRVTNNTTTGCWRALLLFIKNDVHLVVGFC